MILMPANDNANADADRSDRWIGAKKNLIGGPYPYLFYIYITYHYIDSIYIDFDRLDFNFKTAIGLGLWLMFFIANG